MLDRHLTPSDARRREFGDFLRSRRERLKPRSVGLPDGARRRTPGLRREEVALLADVGTTWYTWLEQGRDVHASVEVLNALAVALRLDATERRHLFLLAERSPAAPYATGPERVPEGVIRMLDSMLQQPAYVLGRRWDILAWNAQAVAVFGDYGRFEGDSRNLIHMMFTNDDHRKLLLDWDDLAPLSLAMFRASSAQNVGDPDFERLITTLIETSPEFREWWPRREIVRQPSTIKRINHPTAGQLNFEYTALDITDCPGMRLVVCTPVVDSAP